MPSSWRRREAERADGGAEAAPTELGSRPDRLEEPDAVLVVGPDEPLVLAQPPRNVTDVPGRPRPEQPPLLEGELLHPFDDLRRESHV